MARPKKSKNPLHRYEERSVTAEAIIARKRRVTKADLRSKLREIGAYADDTDDAVLAVAEIVAEEAVDEAVDEAAEAEVRRDLGPVAVLLNTVPRTQLVLAIGFSSVIIVYKLGELMTRRRGPVVEVRKLTFPPGT